MKMVKYLLLICFSICGISLSAMQIPETFEDIDEKADMLADLMTQSKTIYADQKMSKDDKADALAELMELSVKIGKTPTVAERQRQMREKIEQKEKEEPREIEAVKAQMQAEKEAERLKQEAERQAEKEQIEREEERRPSNLLENKHRKERK